MSLVKYVSDYMDERRALKAERNKVEELIEDIEISDKSQWERVIKEVGGRVKFIESGGADTHKIPKSPIRELLSDYLNECSPETQAKYVHYIKKD